MNKFVLGPREFGTISKELVERGEPKITYHRPGLEGETTPVITEQLILLVDQ